MGQIAERKGYIKNEGQRNSETKSEGIGQQDDSGGEGISVKI